MQGLSPSPNRWFRQTPLRALLAAYEAAQRIQQLEQEFFQGEVITQPSPHGANVQRYLEAELQKNLRLIQVRLREFRLSSWIMGVTDLGRTARLQLPGTEISPYNGKTVSAQAVDADILDKLRTIDQVVNRYRDRQGRPALTKPRPADPVAEIPTPNSSSSQPRRPKASSNPGVLPRSLGRALNELQRRVSANPADVEKQIVGEFRQTRSRTRIALSYLFVLVTVPVLVNVIADRVILDPLVDRIWDRAGIFLNPTQEERAYAELLRYENRLKLEVLLGRIPEPSPTLLQEKIQARAEELANTFGNESAEAIKHVIADLLSVITFVILVVKGRPQMAAIKAFLDEMIYGISDTAKAFLIILFTDMFVGFHSAEGWEVIVGSTLRRFGLPESQSFTYLFIAIVPVVLDAIFKYWIFRYLNRISPSAVATLSKMNE
ncbi:MAG: hypothetical protein IGQ88_04690 [Gloeomargaritaceae cyanobacterium C42_A2020_066]|nr:hypothetical protein [Gloeomargaritaceae cyanobacterium C42_A2020_066]